MTKTGQQNRETEHAKDCPKPGFRYATTRNDGMVVMVCKNPRCSSSVVL